MKNNQLKLGEYEHLSFLKVPRFKYISSGKERGGFRKIIILEES